MRHNVKAIIPNLIFFFLTVIFISSCMNSKTLDLDIIETSASSNKLTQLSEFTTADTTVKISIFPDEAKGIHLILNEKSVESSISGKAIQTITIQKP